MINQDHIDELHNMAIRLHQIAKEYEGKPHASSLQDAVVKVIIARGQLMEAAAAEQARGKDKS